MKSQVIFSALGSILASWCRKGFLFATNLADSEQATVSNVQSRRKTKDGNSDKACQGKEKNFEAKRSLQKFHASPASAVSRRTIVGENPASENLGF